MRPGPCNQTTAIAADVEMEMQRKIGCIANRDRYSGWDPFWEDPVTERKWGTRADLHRTPTKARSHQIEQKKQDPIGNVRSSDQSWRPSKQALGYVLHKSARENPETLPAKPEKRLTALFWGMVEFDDSIIVGLNKA